MAISANSSMTVAQLFKQLIEQLNQAEVDYGQSGSTAEDDVVLLLMTVLAMDFDTLNRAANQVITEQQQRQARALVQRRIVAREPMAYVVGRAYFAGLAFQVDERVLIPRSPFAELIDIGFQPHVRMSEVHRVLDLCTGSGCIGLAIGHYYPHCRVDLADISAAALQVAAANCKHLNLSSRCRLIESDLWQNITTRYDLIVSNPPYVGAQEYRQLPPEFSHEPSMALVSALDGLLIPVKILAGAAEYLAEEGSLFLEVGYSDAALTAALPEVPFHWLSFTQGGQGICVFTRHDLIKYQPYFTDFLERHVA